MVFLNIVEKKLQFAKTDERMSWWISKTQSAQVGKRERKRSIEPFQSSINEETIFPIETQAKICEKRIYREQSYKVQAIKSIR